jgi:hypothetical protein
MSPQQALVFLAELATMGFGQLPPNTKELIRSKAQEAINVLESTIVERP